MLFDPGAVGHPATPVVAESPRRLTGRPPPAAVLDLHGSGKIEPALVISLSGSDGAGGLTRPDAPLRGAVTGLSGVRWCRGGVAQLPLLERSEADASRTDDHDDDQDYLDDDDRQ